jgi:hypothetical protein
MDVYFLKKFVSMLKDGPVRDLVDLGIDLGDLYDICHQHAPREFEAAEDAYRRDASNLQLVQSAHHHCGQLIKDLERMNRDLPPLKATTHEELDPRWPAEQENIEYLRYEILSPLQILAEPSKGPRHRPPSKNEDSFIREISDALRSKAKRFADRHCHLLFNLTFKKNLDVESYSRRRRLVLAKAIT